VRLAAARILIGIGPEAHEAVPALIAGLRDEDLEVLGATLSTLGQNGPRAQAAVPALTDMLADPRLLGYTHSFGVATGPRPHFLRAGVANGRGRSGPGAGPAVPALGAMLGDEQAVIRAAAAEALGGISPAAVPALIQALQDQEKEVRQAAVSALG